MGRTVRLEPKPGNNCFGCGGANEFGMKLAFELDEETRRATGKFVLGPRYGGGAGFAHGGIIAVLLDEAMGKISKLSEERAVTAELNVEYRKPVPVDAEIVVSGWQEEEKGRNRFRVGEIHDAAGNLLARGRGRFVVIGQPVAAG
ncbi:MAG TPA: PaaI family thioesterase [Candidatus Acidoferrum sp.]|nr:PaaI family thioesterase [Candidatus Acidoferrum sp.]